MLSVKFSTPLHEIVAGYASTNSLDESKLIVDALRTMACDRLFTVKEATHFDKDYKCTPL